MYGNMMMMMSKQRGEDLGGELQSGYGNMSPYGGSTSSQHGSGGWNVPPGHGSPSLVAQQQQVPQSMAPPQGSGGADYGSPGGMASTPPAAPKKRGRKKKGNKEEEATVAVVPPPMANTPNSHW